MKNQMTAVVTAHLFVSNFQKVSTWCKHLSTWPLLCCLLPPVNPESTKKLPAGSSRYLKLCSEQCRSCFIRGNYVVDSLQKKLNQPHCMKRTEYEMVRPHPFKTLAPPPKPSAEPASAPAHNLPNSTPFKKSSSFSWRINVLVIFQVEQNWSVIKFICPRVPIVFLPTILSCMETNETSDFNSLWKILFQN